MSSSDNPSLRNNQWRQPRLLPRVAHQEARRRRYGGGQEGKARRRRLPGHDREREGCHGSARVGAQGGRQRLLHVPRQLRPRGPDHHVRPEVRRPRDGSRGEGGEQGRPQVRPRRCLVRRPELQLQRRPQAPQGLHPRVSRRRREGRRQGTQGLHGDRSRRPRHQEPQGVRLWPPSLRLPRLQCADPAALRPRRERPGELRARPLRALPQSSTSA